MADKSTTADKFSDLFKKALTDAEGNYTIKDVPPGSYTLKVWNKKLQSEPQKVEVKEGANVQAN